MGTPQVPDDVHTMINQAAEALYRAFPIIEPGDQVAPSGQLSWNAAIESGYDQPYRRAAEMAVNTLSATLRMS